MEEGQWCWVLLVGGSSSRREASTLSPLMEEQWACGEEEGNSNEKWTWTHSFLSLDTSWRNGRSTVEFVHNSKE